MLAVLGKNIKAVKTGDLFLFGVHSRATAFGGPGFERQLANEPKKHEDAAQNIAREETTSLETRILTHSLPPSGLARWVIAEAYQGAVDPGYIKAYPISSTASRAPTVQIDSIVPVHHTGINPAPSSTSSSYTGNIVYVHYTGFSKVVSAYQVEQVYMSVQDEKAADDYVPKQEMSEYQEVKPVIRYDHRVYKAETSTTNDIPSINYDVIAQEKIVYHVMQEQGQAKEPVAQKKGPFVFEIRVDEPKEIMQEKYQPSDNPNPVIKELKDPFVPVRNLEIEEIPHENVVHDSDYRLSEPLDAMPEIKIEQPIPIKAAEIVQPKLDERAYTSNENIVTLDIPVIEPSVQTKIQPITESVQSSYSRVEYFVGVEPKVEVRQAVTELPDLSLDVEVKFDYQVQTQDISMPATVTTDNTHEYHEVVEKPATALDGKVNADSVSDAVYETIAQPRELEVERETSKIEYQPRDKRLSVDDYPSLETRVEPLEIKKENKKCMKPDARVESLEQITDFKEKTAEYTRKDREKKLCAVKVDESFEFYSAFNGPIDVNEIMDEIQARSGDKYTVSVRGADGKDIAATMELEHDDVLAIVYHALVEHKGLMPDLRLQYNIDERQEVQKGVGIKFNGLLADDEGVQYLIQFVEVNDNGEIVRRFNLGDSELTIDQMKADPRYKLDLVKIVPEDLEKSKFPCGGGNRSTYHVRKLDEVNAKRELGNGVYAPELNLVNDEEGSAVRHAYIVGKPFMVESRDVQDGSRKSYTGLDHNLNETDVELNSNHLLAIAGRKIFEEQGSEVIYKKEELTFEDGMDKSRNISYIYDAKGLKDTYKDIFKHAKHANIGVYLFEVDASTGRIVDESGYRPEGLQFVPQPGKVYVAVIGEGNRFDANELVVPKELMPTEYAVSR